MKRRIYELSFLRDLLARVCALFSKDTDVRYTSVPIWRPWRDF